MNETEEAFEGELGRLEHHRGILAAAASPLFAALLLGIMSGRGHPELLAFAPPFLVGGAALFLYAFFAKPWARVVFTPVRATKNALSIGERTYARSGLTIGHVYTDQSPRERWGS